MHWKSRAQDCAEEAYSDEFTVHLLSNQVDHFFLTNNYLNMVNVEGVEGQALEYPKNRGGLSRQLL